MTVLLCVLAFAGIVAAWHWIDRQAETPKRPWRICAGYRRGAYVVQCGAVVEVGNVSWTTHTTCPKCLALYEAEIDAAA